MWNSHRTVFFLFFLFFFFENSVPLLAEQATWAREWVVHHHPPSPPRASRASRWWELGQVGALQAWFAPGWRSFHCSRPTLTTVSGRPITAHACISSTAGFRGRRPGFGLTQRHWPRAGFPQASAPPAACAAGGMCSRGWSRPTPRQVTLQKVCFFRWFNFRVFGPIFDTLYVFEILY